MTEPPELQLKRPRPWFLSLTALWSDDERASQALDEALSLLDKQGVFFPAHHIQVRREIRHITLFAIAKITNSPCSDMPLREFAKELLAQLVITPELIRGLTDSLGTGIALDAYELRSYDDATVVQFQSEDTLGEFRDNARTLLADPIDTLRRRYPDTLIEPLIHDCAKSRGTHAFGSVARSPSRSDLSALRWQRRFDKPISFRFKRIHLLTSDHALSNPRGNDEDYEITSGA